MISPDIFVPESKLEEYLASHNMVLERLDNGLTIVGATHLDDETAYARVGLEFSSGAYRDPSGKQGTLHITEHLVFDKVGKMLSEFEAEGNANTGSTTFNFYVEGPAKVGVDQYGIWPVLPVLCDQVQFKFQIDRPLLDREKEIVVSELNIHKNDREDQVHSILKRTVLAPENPNNINRVETEESIRAITVEDVEAMARSVLIPRGTFARVYVDGDNSAMNQILGQLHACLEGFPRADQEPVVVDKSLLETLNPDFVPGIFYLNKSGGDSGLVYVDNVWVYNFGDYSVEDVALSRFSEFLNGRLKKTIRDMGISYRAGFNTYYSSPSLRISYMRYVAQKGDISIDIAKKHFQQIREEVLMSLSDQDLQKINDLSRNRLLATRPTYRRRISEVIHGLREYGEAIDSNKVDEIFLSISLDHLRDIRNKFLDTTPTIVLTGDLELPETS